MPAKFIIDSGRGVVFSKGIGVFTFPEALEYMEKLRVDPHFKAEFSQIVDCRDVTKAVLTGEQVRELAARSSFSPKSRRAFVVSSDLQFGLSRMFGAYQEALGSAGVMVFREMAEALSWLGLPAGSDPHVDDCRRES